MPFKRREDKRRSGPMTLEEMNLWTLDEWYDIEDFYGSMDAAKARFDEIRGRLRQGVAEEVERYVLEGRPRPEAPDPRETKP